MYQISNFTDNDDVKIISRLGAFQVIEYQRDLSITPSSAVTAFYSAQMNVKKRQLVCDLSQSPVTIQAGAMQWMLGNVNATTGIKGVGDFFGKAVRGKASGESTIKPEYTGNGILVLEPTYRHLILLDVADWGGSVVLDDGLFLACESSLKHKAVMRANLSSAVAGGEGLFNLSLNGNGVACIEASCPREELIVIRLDNDVLKVEFWDRLEQHSGLYGGAVRKEPHRLCGLWRGAGERIPGHRKGPDDANGQYAQYLKKRRDPVLICGDNGHKRVFF